MTVANHQQQANKSLHPTPYSPFVPHSLSGAGEFSRCVAARGLVAVDICQYVTH
jgi:hypothetical protein